MSAIKTQYIFEDLDSNYRKKTSLGVIFLNIALVLVSLVVICFLAFSIVFMPAKVIGCSMQPLFNANLQYSDDFRESIYQDTVYVNRFDKGTNGDVVLANVDDDIVIKRIIARGGQRLTLRRESDGYYHYYLSCDEGIGSLIDEYYVDDAYRTGMNYGYYNEFLSLSGVVENPIYIGGEASLVIPRGKIFILGDNREVSRDSHSYGAIDEDAIVGKVAFYYSYNQTFLDFVWQEVCSVF